MNSLVVRLAVPLLGLALACTLPSAGPAGLASAIPSEPAATAAPASTARPSPTTRPIPTPVPTDLVWFGPNMGSLDFPQLFTKPELWSEARSQIDVFKFHTQNVLPYPCTPCGDNTLSAFVTAHAFERLTEWGIAIDIDVGAVKEWGCNGTEEFRVVKEAIRNVTLHGGEVGFLDMDEPYLGGELTANGKSCSLTMEQTADITAKWMRLVKGNYPNIVVSDTEPYPRFSVSQLEQWWQALEARGATPASFHLDVNILEGGYRHDAGRVSADLEALRQYFEARHVPFGVIFTDTTFQAKSDRAYFDATMEWLRLVNDAVGRPQHVVFNSWLGPAPSGAHEFPINLPDDDPSIFSHTRLIMEGLEALGH